MKMFKHSRKQKPKGAKFVKLQRSVKQSPKKEQVDESSDDEVNASENLAKGPGASAFGNYSSEDDSASIDGQDEDNNEEDSGHSDNSVAEDDNEDLELEDNEDLEEDDNEDVEVDSNEDLEDDDDLEEGVNDDLEDDNEELDEEENADEASDDSQDGNAEQEDESDDGGESGDDFSKHKQSLSKLKDLDPELYKYLEENDRKLLQFNLSDSDSEKEDDVHAPPEALEGDSEESDFEDETGSTKKKSNVITLAMVAEWRDKLTSEPTVASITTAVQAFEAALDRVTGEKNSTYTVDGSGVFNAVVEMCVVDFVPSVMKFLKHPNAKQPSKSKKWIKIRAVVNTYLSHVLKLVSGVASGQIVSVLLKHVHTAIYLMSPFPKLMRTSLKLLAKLWSSAEETTRVLAYLCILRIVTSAKEGHSSYLNHSLKLMYMGFVKGSKFVSVGTLPQINFMRRSLADLMTVNPTLTYQHAFLYIRQLAIHLRNAVTILKKERFQTVYNWQYINCLDLWVELLCHKKAELEQLAYPLVTIILGVIKLIPTAQYTPLRFHCIRMLNKLMRETETFVPVLPFITEAFTIVNLNAKHKKVSMKPFDFTCILRLSKAAMTETAFTDAVVEYVCELLMETCYCHHSSISFPDLLVPTIVQLKSVIKDTKSPKYISKLKHILTKIEENAKLISNERNKLGVNLSETNKIKAWEMKIRTKGTPISKYREEWCRRHKLQTIKKITGADEINENNIPTIRKDLKRKSSGPAVLLPSDDEDEMTTLLCGPGVAEKQMEGSEKRMKLEEKEIKKDSDASDVDGEDIVEELNLETF